MVVLVLSFFFLAFFLSILDLSQIGQMLFRSLHSVRPLGGWLGIFVQPSVCCFVLIALLMCGALLGGHSLGRLCSVREMDVVI